MKDSDKPMDGRENRLSYHYDYVRSPYINKELKHYIDKEKLNEVTAQLVGCDIKDVEAVIDYVFRHLRYWLDEPSVKGCYWIENWFAFEVDTAKCDRMIERQLDLFRRVKEAGAYITPYNKDRFRVVRKRAQLGREYDKRSKHGSNINRTKRN